MLGSIPDLKTTCIEASPSLPASEAMYLIPGTPLMALSIGITTALIINSPFAPGYSATIFTLGGEIEGYWVTGNLAKAITPNKVMISEITIDRTGLCINLLNIKLQLGELGRYCFINCRLLMISFGS